MYEYEGNLPSLKVIRIYRHLYLRRFAEIRGDWVRDKFPEGGDYDPYPSGWNSLMGSRVFIDPDTIIFSGHSIGRWIQRFYGDLPKGEPIPEGARIQAMRMMRQLLSESNPGRPEWDPRYKSWLWKSGSVTFVLNSDKSAVKTVLY